MKRTVADFFRRGLIACGLGPLVLAVVYLALKNYTGLEALSVDSVCRGIFSLTALAFVAGGMNMVYTIERLPLAMAILIHGGVLYAAYLATYLVNNWLEPGYTPILVFSGIFAFGYLVIWAGIYIVTKRSTERINKMLEQNQKSESDG